MGIYTNGGGLPQTGIGFLDGHLGLAVSAGLVAILIGASLLLAMRRRKG